MENETLDNTTEKTGLEIITEKAVELKKDEFFNMLKREPKGLELTVDRVGKVYKSKWANDNGKYPSGCFIDYSFTKDSTDYEVGISYNLGLPVAEDTFKLTSGMNIFKILEVAIDLSKAEEIKVTKDFIDKTLTGIKFIGEIDSGYNGFIIKPVKLIE